LRQIAAVGINVDVRGALWNGGGRRDLECRGGRPSPGNGNVR